MDLQPEKLLASDTKTIMEEIRVAKGTETEGLALEERDGLVTVFLVGQ